MEILQNLQLKGVYEFILRDAKTGEVKQVEKIENLVPTVGLNALAQQLSGDNTQEAEITYLALGNNADTPVLADTALGSETVRKLITLRTTSSNIANFSIFFASGEANDTHKEVGVFGDGAASMASAAADSGIMYSRALIIPTIIKTSSDTLQINYSFTLS